MKFTISAEMLRAAMTCQAKNDVRYYLNGVLFTTTGDILATNGHVMFRGRADFELPEDMILAIDKAPIKSIETVEIDLDRKVATYYKSRGTESCGLSVIGGKFPDWERIIPREENRKAVDAIGIQSWYLALPEKAFGKTPLKWEFYGAENAMTVEPTEGDWNGAFIVIMPARLS